MDDQQMFERVCKACEILGLEPPKIIAREFNIQIRKSPRMDGERRWYSVLTYNAQESVTYPAALEESDPAE